MTDYVCKNHKEIFCDDPLSTEINIEDIQKIDDNVDQLSSQISKFKDATDRKFDALLGNLEHLKAALKSNELIYQDVNENLNQFETMFNNTLSSQKELN